MIRRPRILDVLRAAEAVRSEHPHVRVWWYVPDSSLQLKGEAPSHMQPPFVELAVEPIDAAASDCDRLSLAMSRQLEGYPVRVRIRSETDRGLFRLVSIDAQSAVQEPSCR
jgi:hypothetical protein